MIKMMAIRVSSIRIFWPKMKESQFQPFERKQKESVLGSLLRGRHHPPFPVNFVGKKWSAVWIATDSGF